MREPLCKYCGNPMLIDSIEYTDIWYKCKCEGYLKEQKLLTEIRDIEDSLWKKKDELQNHKSNNLYAKSIRELKKKLEETEELYRD
jgi:hypothetical protein